MFSDIDEALRRLLTADMPIERNEIEIAFDRPTREWSTRLTKPALNLFLFDVRERTELRDQTVRVEIQANGLAVRRWPEKRLDLAYTVTAFAKEPADEHRILSRALATMFRHRELPEQHRSGELLALEEPVLLRVMAPDYLAKPADFWGVMDNEMRMSLTWVATAPMDPFLAIEGPIVRTAEFAFGRMDEAWRERTRVVAGVVHAGGGLTDGIEGVRVTVPGTTIEATTDPEGRFALGHLLPGEYRWRVEAPGREVREVSMTVPSATYDISLAM